jgi:hypothetical protein
MPKAAILTSKVGILMKNSSILKSKCIYFDTKLQCLKVKMDIFDSHCKYLEAKTAKNDKSVKIQAFSHQYVYALA